MSIGARLSIPLQIHVAVDGPDDDAVAAAARNATNGFSRRAVIVVPPFRLALINRKIAVDLVIAAAVFGVAELDLDMIANRLAMSTRQSAMGDLDVTKDIFDKRCSFHRLEPADYQETLCGRRLR